MSAPPPESSPEVLFAEAIARRQAGRLGEAAALFAHLLRLGTPRPDHLLMAAETLYRTGLLQAAQDALTAVRALAPHAAEIDFLLGRVELVAGQPEAAAVAFRRAVERQPTPVAWRFLGAALFALGREDESAAAFDNADAMQFEPPEGYNEFGISLLAERRPREAESAFRRALSRAPRLVAAHQNLGVALADQEKLDEACAAERRAVEIMPGSAAGWLNLSVFASAAGDFAAGRAACERAAAIAPDTPDVLANLARLRLEEGDAAAAASLLERALAQAPAHRSAADSWLLARNYVTEGDDTTWRAPAVAIAARLRPDAPALAHANDRDPGRRLRVGFVSADFRQHSCASFLAPLFQARDPGAYELFAYSDNPRDDEVTGTLRSAADRWQDIDHLGDVAVAEKINTDRIDILVDLSGHMAGNRLPVFALKPAPVQVSWLGYPDTTGLDTIDYRLTDAVADPPGTGDRRYTERLWRLPGCFLAFNADRHAPDVPPEPNNAGPPVFVSFNHLPKITPAVVAVWARILAAVPEARLLMKAKRLGEPETRRRYVELFAAHGIGPDRLELVGWQAAPADHLALYRRASVALDPFPYNGTTTTCEALWMGVPVVTLAGRMHAARVGASLLNAMGLPELVAESEDDYVTRAAALAKNSGRQQALRAGLRARMAASPLCDAKGFAGRFEAALREMWRTWCRTAG